MPYKVGDSFVMMSIEEVRERLERESEKIEEVVDGLEGKLRSTRQDMEGLKTELYARFGRSINLET